MPDSSPTLDDVKAYFSNDQFATKAAGCRIVEARSGYAVCAMDLAPVHRNAAGAVMGGAIFTLADFAVAVACNAGQPPAVSASSTIEFLSSVKGTRLIATCTADKEGSRLGFYTVNIADDTGRPIARMCATCARV